MSKIVEAPETYILTENGDGYANHIDFITGKPLDTGRLLYVRLRRALSDEYQIEVWFNHFSNEVTAIITGRDFESETTFKDEHMPRSEKIAFINRIVEGASSSLS